jgi:hypothetical protein
MAIGYKADCPYTHLEIRLAIYWGDKNVIGFGHLLHGEATVALLKLQWNGRIQYQSELGRQLWADYAYDLL